MQPNAQSISTRNPAVPLNALVYEDPVDHKVFELTVLPAINNAKFQAMPLGWPHEIAIVDPADAAEGSVQYYVVGNLKYKPGSVLIYDLRLNELRPEFDTQKFATTAKQMHSCIPHIWRSTLTVTEENTRHDWECVVLRAHNILTMARIFGRIFSVDSAMGTVLSVSIYDMQNGPKTDNPTFELHVGDVLLCSKANAPIGTAAWRVMPEANWKAITS